MFIWGHRQHEGTATYCRAGHRSTLGKLLIMHFFYCWFILHDALRTSESESTLKRWGLSRPDSLQCNGCTKAVHGGIPNHTSFKVCDQRCSSTTFILMSTATRSQQESHIHISNQSCSSYRPSCFCSRYFGSKAKEFGLFLAIVHGAKQRDLMLYGARHKHLSSWTTEANPSSHPRKFFSSGGPSVNISQACRGLLQSFRIVALLKGP